MARATKPSTRKPSAPALARDLQACINTHMGEPDTIVIGVRHRNGLTELDITTPDAQFEVQPALYYWLRLKDTYHLHDFALWDTYHLPHPTRNHTSVITLVEGTRIPVQWEPNLHHVDVGHVQASKIMVIPPCRALMVLPDAA